MAAAAVDRTPRTTPGRLCPATTVPPLGTAAHAGAVDAIAGARTPRTPVTTVNLFMAHLPVPEHARFADDTDTRAARFSRSGSARRPQPVLLERYCTVVICNLNSNAPRSPPLMPPSDVVSRLSAARRLCRCPVYHPPLSYPL